MRPRNTSTEDRPYRRFYRVLAAHLFALSGFGIAQPIFSVYRSNAEIFVARRTGTAEIIALALILTLVPSVIMLAVATALGGIRHSWGIIAGRLFIFLLIMVFVLQIITRTSSIPWQVAVVLSVVVGALATFAYLGTQLIRDYLTYLALGPIVFLLIFLLAHPIFGLVFSASGGSLEAQQAKSNAPVVFILFDELPLLSLLDADGEINAERYPNFVTLANQSHWFRFAAAAHPYSARSIPALLSSSPAEAKLPTAAEYPNNLFTMLRGSYELHVQEIATVLCPTSVCGQDSARRRSFRSELGTLLRTSWELYQRILLPRLFDDRIESLDDPFDVSGVDIQGEIHGAMKADRVALFREFLGTIDGSDGQFYFRHTFLPHGPLQYLPSGSVYNRGASAEKGLSKSGYWEGEEWYVLSNHQRHLLQTKTVDLLIGELLDRLEVVDALDKSMIVITSDHGVNHRPNDARRDITETSVNDIAWVPLFIKAPFQRGGVVHDELVPAIDVVPTIADLLGVEMPWESPGRSVLDDRLEPRTEVTMMTQDAQEILLDPEARSKALDRIIHVFGSGRGDWDLFAFGPYAHLVGQNAATLEAGDGELRVEFEDSRLYFKVDLESRFVPAWVEGQIMGSNIETEAPYVAIVVNQRIGAVVPTLDVEAEAARFGSVVPESLFVSGNNVVSLIAIAPDGNGFRASRIMGDIGLQFTLLLGDSESQPRIQDANGVEYVIEEGAVRGFVDSAARPDGAMQLSGWAVQEPSQIPAERIVVFVDGQFVGSAQTGRERPGFSEASRLSGYGIRILSDVLPKHPREVQVFGLAHGKASELIILESALDQLVTNG